MMASRSVVARSNRFSIVVLPAPSQPPRTVIGSFWGSAIESSVPQAVLEAMVVVPSALVVSLAH